MAVHKSTTGFLDLIPVFSFFKKISRYSILNQKYIPINLLEFKKNGNNIRITNKMTKYSNVILKILNTINHINIS